MMGCSALPTEVTRYLVDHGICVLRSGTSVIRLFSLWYVLLLDTAAYYACITNTAAYLVSNNRLYQQIFEDAFRDSLSCIRTIVQRSHHVFLDNLSSPYSLIRQRSSL